MKIAITTAPRKESTLKQTLDSLYKAGFNDIDVFNDENLVGAWPFWYSTLKEMVERYPKEDYYGVFQDDIQMNDEGVLDYLKMIKMPEDMAVCSLFFPQYYVLAARKIGWNLITDPSLWMAQALIFSAEASRSILNSQIVWSLRGTKQIDNRIGLWANLTGGKVYFHYPSLCEHIGETSTLWDGPLSNAKRAAMQPLV